MTLLDDAREYVLSDHCRYVLNGDQAVAWHSLFGRPLVVSKSLIDFLSFFKTPNTISRACAHFQTSEDEWPAIEEALKACYLVLPGVDERDSLRRVAESRFQDVRDGKRIRYLELIMTSECNFRCSYCIHFSNRHRRGPNEKKKMSFALAKEAVDWFLSVLERSGHTIAEINFGGGEPLLNWLVVEQVVDYCQTTYKDRFAFKYLLNTNGSLITKPIAGKIASAGFEVATSLDGLAAGNDLVRKTRRGGGTFSNIINGWGQLKKAGYPLDGFCVTLNEANIDRIDEAFFDWVYQNGFRHLRMDVDILTLSTLPLDAIIEKILAFRIHGKARGIDVFGFWSRALENLNESMLENDVAFCGAVRGNNLCVDPSGDIFPCGYSNHRIGHMQSRGDFFEDRGDYFSFKAGNTPGGIEVCHGCMIEGQCAGGCHITREYAASQKGSPVNGRVCNFFRDMAKHLLLEQLASM